MLYRTTNSLVYSVSYENYQNKILEDKENKTQGNWNISKDKIPHLKYAYVYLKNSNKMIVKKYKILHFERNKPEKGYDDIEKQCFVFTESEDVFVAMIAFVAISPTCFKTFVFMSKSSTMASIIKSQSDKSFNAVVVVIRS